MLISLILSTINFDRIIKFKAEYDPKPFNTIEFVL